MTADLAHNPRMHYMLLLLLLALLSIGAGLLVLAAGGGLMADVALIGLVLVFAVSIAGLGIMGELRGLREDLRDRNKRPD